MNAVKRYEIEQGEEFPGGDHNSAYMEEYAEGRWVRYEDYQSLEAKSIKDAERDNTLHSLALAVVEYFTAEDPHMRVEAGKAALREAREALASKPAPALDAILSDCIPCALGLKPGNSLAPWLSHTCAPAPPEHGGGAKCPNPDCENGRIPIHCPDPPSKGIACAVLHFGPCPWPGHKATEER